ncbi:MAG: YhjD/YihY/BrkB family envelope integrity protein [Acidimicrobiales bacterium]
MFDIQKWRARWSWLNALLTITDRFGAIGGGPLASSIALASFVSLFPLLLVAIAVIGFVSSGDSGFARSLIRELGLQGSAAETVQDAIATAEGSRRAASVVGFVGLLSSGLGVVGSLQTGLNAAWQAKGRGLLDRLVALRWLLGAGALFLVTAALGPLLRWAPGPVKPLTIVAGLALTTVLFLWTYHSLGNSNVPWRVHLPGALLVAVGFEILKVVGSILVPRAVASSSALYGSLGVVFAVLALLLLYGRLIMYGAVLNVVRYEAGAGTVTVEIEVPRIDGEVPLTTNRGGAVEESVEASVD